jgi:Reverse transcriptase (RNA-dependent DNA polymerase)
MPFGLVNAPAPFQRSMENILSEARWESFIVYLDDVIIFSRTFEDHVRHLEVVLRKLGEPVQRSSFRIVTFSVSQLTI